MRLEEGSDLTRGFDLLWNGLEVTTGAQREHRYDVLVKQAKERLGNIESDKTQGHRSSITQRSVRTQPCVMRAARPGNCTGSDGADGRGALAA